MKSVTTAPKPKAVAKKVATAAPKTKTKKLKNFFTHAKNYALTHQDWLVICIIITVKVSMLLANIGGYPYYENDEATYTLRASTFAETGQLDYYTYWYDHAPAGWITLSPVIAVNNAIGNPVNNLLLMRLAMVALATAVAILTYLIGVKLFKKRLPAILAVTLLLFSPLLMYYQRRVLLDNVMIFWLLLSMYFVLNKPHKLRSYAFSGVLFGIAILSKINAAFVVPVMWLLIWQSQSHKVIRRHALVLWTFLAGAVTSMWLLYAGLKGELLPYSAHPETGAFEKISLLDTLKFQSARGGDPKLPWDPTSNIYPNAVDWFSRDTMFVGLFVVAVIVAILLLWRKNVRKEVGIILFTLVMLGLFMIRGGVVLGFYILPLAPFAALIVGWAMFHALAHLKHVDFRRTVAALCIAGIAFANIPAIAAQWHTNETANQLAAVEWVKANVPDKNALIISDNYALPYLVSAGYTNVDYQYKVEYDPAINEKKYQKDWRNGAYIIMSHEVIKQIKEGVTPFVKEAFDHSELVADFRNKSSSFIDIQKYTSTNGDWAQVYKIKSDEGVLLQDSWDSYKEMYIRSYGQVLDPETSKTTAYNQAVTMQMALEEDDHQIFNGVWQWTKDHFQNRTQDKLLSSEWGTKDGKEGLTDANANTNASLQAIHALLKAEEKWHGGKYKADAEKLIADLQKVGFRKLGGLNVQIAFATTNADSYLINPSYADPSTYMQIATAVADPQAAQFWQNAYNDYFVLLGKLQNATTGLVPNWVRMFTGGTTVSATTDVGPTGDIYGYEAFRIPFYLARDLKNSPSSAAAVPLQKLNRFFASQFLQQNQKGTLYATYTVNGQPSSAFEDVATNTSAIATYASFDTARMTQLQNEKIFGQYDSNKKVWGKVSVNIRNQQTAWQYVSMYFERL